MRRIVFLAVMACGFALPARAADKPPQPKLVARIDSLIATEAGGSITIQAKGAVPSGGWKRATLKAVKSGDTRTIAVEFIATPPPPSQVVITALLPVSASATVPMRRGVVSVRAVSGSNEITTQLLT